MASQTPKETKRKSCPLQVKQALSSLSELQSSPGKKKFKRRILKVERILSEGLSKQKKVKKLKQEAAA